MSQTYASRRSLPSLMALRAFEAGARLGSFTLAAKELLLTQSAVSRHVRNLELYLDVPLFLRNGRQLVLTPQGHNYLATLSDAFDRIDAATASLRQRRSDDVLTVSMLPSVAVKWFTPLLTKFFEAYPTVDLRISASPRLVNFDRDGIDVAIRYGRGDWDGVESEQLAREQIFPVCSPRLARGAKQLTICEDLKDFTLLHGDIRQDWSTWLHVASCGHLDATRGPRFDDAVPLIQAAIDGVGVALGRTLLVANDLAAGRLVAPFVTRLDAEFSYWIVTPRGRAQHPRAAEFRTWLLAQIPSQ